MGKNNVLISVVIPLYNKAHTIVKTLDTVFAQTYRNFEIVIVDDGSTDNGVQVICDNFNDSRIRIVRQKNSGVSVARNRSVDEAKGDWISFLDADDEWLPEYLEEVSEAIKRKVDTHVILAGRYSQNIRTGHKVSNVPSKYKDKVVSIGFFENPHVFMHISATTIKADILKPLTTWNNFIEGQKSNEDFTFLFRIIMHCSNVLYIGKPLSIYNGGIEGQATSVLKKQKILDDGILFRNAVWNEFTFIADKTTRKEFKIFMRYETRHTVLGMIRTCQYEQLRYFLDGLNRICILNSFNFLELFLYRHRSVKIFTLVYIYFTKLIWRCHGFPRIK